MRTWCVLRRHIDWGLRDYGLEGVEWPAVSYAPMAGLPPVEVPAWSGCLGLEPDPAMFVGHIVLVARELWRVLRDDGTFWLNFGDSYAGGAGGRGDAGRQIRDPSQGGGITAKHNGERIPRNAVNLKPKDLIGIPWRVAFALQADGWYLRSDIIWAKGVSFCPTYSGSCMPESVRDRPTTGHEHVFLLSKNKRYFYDGDAVREANAPLTIAHFSGNKAQRKASTKVLHKQDIELVDSSIMAGRNLRTVWTINPGSYAGAHFATFPPALVEPMIKAGTSAKGCCPECGAPWVRVTTKEPIDYGMGKVETNHAKAIQANGNAKKRLRSPTGHTLTKTTTETTGWRPTCSCGTEHSIPQEELDADPTLLDDFEIEPFEPVPCAVLDPFLGSGTTAEVAIRLGRAAVGIELSQKYCDEHIKTRLSKGIQMEMTL